MEKKNGPVGFVRSILRILAGKPQIPASLQDNQALNAILNRRSVRSFAKREIPDDVFAAILEAGRLAPSTVNLQTWSFAVFTSASWRETNASLAAMNMNIAAETLGVSSVMLSETGRTGLLDTGYLKQVLRLPDRVVPIMTIVFGYRRGSHPPMPPKLPLEQICFGDKYQEADRAVMEDWLAQTKAGYKTVHPLSSFEAQLLATPCEGTA